MRLSTSSSNDRLPVGRWRRTWTLIALQVLFILFAWEVFWRLDGFRPTVVSHVNLWVHNRLQVRERSTVVVGTSRIQLALAPDDWGRVVGDEPPIQLATAGGSTIRFLEHFAADSSFRGWVVADIVPFFTFDTDSLPTTLVDTRVSEYRTARASPAARSEAYLRAYLTSLVVFRLPELQYIGLRHAFDQKRWPIPNFVEVDMNGSQRLDFGKAGIAANRPSILDPGTFQRLRTSVPTDQEFGDQLVRLTTAIRTIQGRGGRVLLIHMPACGGRRIVEERFFPKEKYWGAVVRLGVAPTLDLDDFRDRPLPCQDGSHVDAQDAPAVTRWIARQAAALLSTSLPSAARFYQDRSVG